MKKQSSPSSGKGGADFGLTPEEKNTLREIARQSIRCRCTGAPAPKWDNAVLSNLTEQCGAFVSIHKHGDLRGCIGMIQGCEPLWKTIEKMAVQAAFCDPRFHAVNSSELDDLDIEISVLTPLEPVGDPSEIEVGKHGLVIRNGCRSGLLLPQVATEHGWSVEEFLEWTCRKANLPADAWKEPETEIYRFSADVF